MKVNSDSILNQYSQLLWDKEVKNLQKKARKFENNEILHVNATKYGGGVAEILNNMIPLMRELKLDADWKVFSAPDSFFEISKKMHNALQGNMEIHF